MYLRNFFFGGGVASVYNKGVQEGARFASLLDLLENDWQPQRPFQRHCPVACSILLGDKDGGHVLSTPGIYFQAGRPPSFLSQAGPALCRAVF